MGVELDEVTLSVDEVLGKVPGDLGIGSLSLQVLVDGTGILTLDISLAEEGESNRVVRSDPLVDLLLRPWFLCTELVTGNSEDSESTGLMGGVHLFVLAVVPIRQASLGSNIDHNDGLGTFSKGSNGDILLSVNFAR